MAPDAIAEARTHVLLDCTAIPAHRGGVGRYIEGLLGGLKDDRIALSLVVQRRDEDALSRIAPWATVRAVSRLFQLRALRLAWEQLSLPRIARQLGADVVHSPHYTFPRAWRGGRVVTLHDATFFSHPEGHDRVKRWFFRMWTRRSWREANVVITPSAATGSEITRFLGAPNAAVKVAHLGVDLARFHRPTPAEISEFRKDTPALKGSFWFSFLGTIEPRKNVGALMRGYRLLRDELGEKTPELLISGDRGWDHGAIASLDSLPENSGVHELGYLPVSRLPALLGGATAVIYPSVGEGFGLPVLEAMACGAAVITTARLAIPEVGGDAVHYVEPTPDGIRDGLRSLLLDGRGNQRLRARAAERASQFTWHATASHHIAAYELAAGSRNSG